jgi:hypothetical protein
MRNVVRLDVDGPRPLPLAELAKRARRARRRLVAMRQWRSPSGRGWHCLVLVDPPPRTAVETVALQLLFGSDPRREAYNLNRARQVDAGTVPRYWRHRWNVLYGKVRHGGSH